MNIHEQPQEHEIMEKEHGNSENETVEQPQEKINSTRELVIKQLTRSPRKHGKTNKLRL